MLQANNLTGKIPAAIANLTALKELMIRTNNISGKIPAAMFSLTALERLELYSNQLTGGIPSGISSLTNLKYLRLYGNPLGGSIPSSIGSLTNLEQLQINSCQLTGAIPGSLKKLIKLKVLEIGTNSFTGSFPPLGKLSALLTFTASTLTSLTAAPIPAWLDSCRSLVNLNLDNSNRNGSIPSFIGNLTALESLLLRNNQLTGSIPDEIGNLVVLGGFGVNNNQLSGSIPATIGNLTELRTLLLQENQLTGTLPPSFYELTKLETAYINANQLYGSVSNDIANLTALTALSLYENDFSGEIPSGIGGLTNLTFLQLGANQFSGNIPGSLKLLTKLKSLYLNDNLLSGTVPNLGTLTDLETFQLMNNQLEGSIGSWIGSLTKLKVFRMDFNKFTSLDNSILSLPLLTNVYLSSNELTSVPNFYTYSNKANLNLYMANNHLDFSDLEPLFGSGTHGIKAFTYAPQKKFNTLLKLHVPTGEVLEIAAQPKGSYSTVTWEKQNGASWTSMNSGNENTTQQTYKKSSVTTTINGYYRWRMTNSRVTGLTLECEPIEVQAVDPLPAEPGGPALFNGIIASARWQTEKPVDESGDNLTGMYLYKYDEKYQIADANFVTPNYLLDTYATQANKFRVTNLAYDPNGNIKTLNRYDKDGVRTNNFSYTYTTNKNQLTDVSGHTSAGISGHGYGYNAIGQMTGTDKATGDDQYVTYDVSGKVRRVYSNSAKTSAYLTVEYLYDDRGFRLAKYSKADDRTTWYIRDASGVVMSIYEQDGEPLSTNAHAVIQVEIPVYGAGKLGTYYPAQDGSVNYELTDHLGNVRALVRENVNIYTATMEDDGVEDITNPRVQEMQYFENLDETEMEDARFNHTPVPGAEYSAYLYWIAGSGTAHKKIGPAITLKVNAGDTVNAETWVRYENKLSYSRNTSIGAIAALLSGNFSFTSGFEGFTAPQTTTAFTNALTSAGFMGDGSDDERPFAYLNYILFDESMTLVDAGWQRVVDSAGFDVGEEALANRHERIAFEQPIYVPENGYIYVWVSNESEGTKVWFDDVKVTHTQITVTQASDYGVWGDVLRELKAPEFTYRHGYQGNFSEKDKETGWNHFELREYDPVIGRTLIMDPQRQFHSPYAWVGNKPIDRIDPSGGFSPIYSLQGKFLGTDDQGLKGELIFMSEIDFVQGMSHSSALEKGINLTDFFMQSADVNYWFAAVEHAATLSSRPDWDGYLTKAEADAWWNGKSGQPLFVDQSQIKLPGITTDSFKDAKDNSIYHNFVWGMSNTGQVYGTIKLTLLDAAKGSVHIGGKDFLDKYDFSYDGRKFRDFATWVGRPGASDAGKDYYIYGYKTATIPVKK